MRRKTIRAKMTEARAKIPFPNSLWRCACDRRPPQPKIRLVLGRYRSRAGNCVQIVFNTRQQCLTWPLFTRSMCLIYRWPKG
jgi:hypothetical protein